MKINKLCDNIQILKKRSVDSNALKSMLKQLKKEVRGYYKQDRQRAELENDDSYFDKI